ncbi:hypothetical protein WN944_000101 [Citrus x changshan-huyou]|uniref:Uncharacterized protein n=1 Tax=Citrus x changshan-huyou TaxID=2935761 RepID=A0AAP0MDX1_9ROSI
MRIAFGFFAIFLMMASMGTMFVEAETCDQPILQLSKCSKFLCDDSCFREYGKGYNGKCIGYQACCCKLLRK